MALGYHWESMISYIKHVKVSQEINVISLVRVHWEIMFARMIKNVTYMFCVIKLMFVMCGAYDIMRSRQ